MRLIALALLLLIGRTCGEDSGVAQPDPHTFFKIVAAIGKSKIDALVPKTDADGTTYHLRAVHYLGQVYRDQQVYTVAQVAYVRSSPPGRDTPPPRGHGFVILLDKGFEIVACGRSDHGFLHMEGSRLMEGEAEIADFGSTDRAVRYHGYVQLNMPYPFPDRLTEQEWNAKVPIERPKKQP